MTDRILIAGRNPKITEKLNMIAKANGYETDVVSSSTEADDKLNQHLYSVMLIGFDLDDKTSFSFIEEIRKKNNKLPIILILDKHEDWDAMYGLSIGADDFVTQSFSPAVLNAKITALIRRNHCNMSGQNNVINALPFSYQTETMRFFKNGEEIFLTGKELNLMRVFLDNVGRIFSKDLLYEMVWKNDLVDENAVSVYINHLRKKIEDDPKKPKYLQTVRGIGYRFVV